MAKTKKKKTTDKNGKEWISFHEGGKRWMICRHCQTEYCSVGESIVAVTCSSCVQRICISKMSLEEMMAYINEDELLEVTPLNLRLRKRFLDSKERKKSTK